MYFKIFFNQEPSHVAALFSNKGLSAYFLHGPMLYTCFDLSISGRKAYISDNSGPGKIPIPGTNVDQQNRLEHRAFKWHHSYLAGPGSTGLTKRFEQSFEGRILSFAFAVESGHLNSEDLMDTVKDVLMGPAIIDAILAPALFKRQPEFLKSFWIIHANTWKLVAGLPRWLAPKPRTAVRRCLEAIKAWHAWARSHSDAHVRCTDSNQDDAFWGSKFIRERQLYVGTVDGFTQDDIATHDLALVWA